jgi:hypothetical protein
MHPRLFIFAGRFGSGKTESAVNFAIQLAQGQYPTVNGWGKMPAAFNSHPLLVDLDIVTPYFRSRELGETLRALDVEVVAPAAIGRHLDVPAISPEILGAIEQQGQMVVLDVGGDPQGARALGQYSATIGAQDYAAYFTVNPYRPFTDTPRGVRDAIRAVEATSRLKMTALISNPNLMNETTLELVLAGHQQVLDVSQAIGLPVALVCVEADLTERVRPHVIELPILGIRRFFDLCWAT